MKVIIPETISAKLHGVVSRGVKAVEVNESGHLIFTLTDDKTVDLGSVIGPQGEDGLDGHSPYIGENGNWFEWDDTAQEYVDTEVPATADDYLPLSGGTMTGDIVLQGAKINFGASSIEETNTSEITLEGDYPGDHVKLKGIDTPVNDNDAANKGYVDDTVEEALRDYTKTDDLADVATSGSYTDLQDKPTIPTVNNAILTIKQGGTIKGTFSANASADAVIDLDAGGGGSDNTFVVTATLSGTTITSPSKTYSEILSAITANKVVELHLTVGGNKTVFTSPVTGQTGLELLWIEFRHVDAGTVYTVRVNSGEIWSYTTKDIATEEWVGQQGYIKPDASGDVTLEGETASFFTGDQGGVETHSVTIVDLAKDGVTLEADYDSNHKPRIMLYGTDLDEAARISNVDTPTADSDAANKGYVDSAVAAAIGDAIGGAY